MYCEYFHYAFLVIIMINTIFFYTIFFGMIRLSRRRSLQSSQSSNERHTSEIYYVHSHVLNTFSLLFQLCGQNNDISRIFRYDTICFDTVRYNICKYTIWLYKINVFHLCLNRNSLLEKLALHQRAAILH